MNAPEIPAPDEAATYRKVTLRLIPFLFLCYILAFLDRVNVGFAKLQMLTDLGFSGAIYGLGAGIFFLGYFLFEVPSNLLLEKFGARVWIARIMITWGLISAVPYLCSIPAMLLLSRSSDRSGERRWHFALSAVLGGAGLILSMAYGQQPLGAVASLSLASAGILAALPVFWSMTTASLAGAAAAGIALINSIGGLAGFMGLI